MSRLSSSGARVRGDDFQHTYAAVRAMEALLAGSNITQIGVEDPDPDVHNADDVTVYRVDMESEFTQAKSSVDASTPATIDWLTEPSRSGGPSILSHLFGAWKDLTDSGQDPRILLVTNKPIDPRDPVLTLREGTDGTVARRLREVGTRSAAGIARADLVNHLDTTEEELLRFLDRLTFRFGVLLEELRSQLSFRLAVTGFRADRQAIDLSVDLVRRWVTTGKRVLTVNEVHEEIESLGIRAIKPMAAVVIQAIDHRPTDTATLDLDWVTRFDGAEARSRRVPREHSDWNDVFRPELLEAAKSLRSSGLSRVHIGGAMRLPTWFAAGNAFGETAGFQVEVFQNGELWTSSGPTADFDLDIDTDSNGTRGNELAIVVSIATDIYCEACQHITGMPNIGTVADIRPAEGVSRSAVATPDAARGLAIGIRDAVRKLVQQHHPARVHLFLAMPGATGMLLGHLWDRVGDTQLYADLAPGYAPAYLIPN